MFQGLSLEYYKLGMPLRLLLPSGEIGTIYCNKWSPQGGILSPYLFNVFIGDPSHVSRKSLYGCYVNGQCFNHVMHADATLLLAPSPVALQNLIDIYSQYFTSHRLVINCKKSKCRPTAICPKSLMDLYFPKLFVNGSLLTNVEKEPYFGFIMTSRDYEDDTICKEARVCMLQVICYWVNLVIVRKVSRRTYLWHIVPHCTVVPYGQPVILYS